ncbi:hypothetical protein SRHO_G00213880 [Serrasalmus rhombeus]
MHRRSALAEDSVAVNDNTNILSPLSQPLQEGGGTAGRLKNAITVLMTRLSNRSFTSGLAALSLTALVCVRLMTSAGSLNNPLSDVSESLPAVLGEIRRCDAGRGTAMLSPGLATV